MADANDKKNQTQATGQQGGQQSGQQGGPQAQSGQPSAQRSGAMEDKERGQRGARMARRGAHAPSMFALSPGAVLSMSPFELMRRFTDELDRASVGYSSDLLCFQQV